MTRGQTISAALDMKQEDFIAKARDALASMPPPLAGEDEVVRRLRENLRDALDELDRIASGNVRRNDATVLRGIELLLRYSQALPKQTIEHQGVTSIQVLSPYADEAPVGLEALPRPPKQALPPIIRKASRPATVREVDQEVALCGRCGGPYVEPHECPVTKEEP